MSRRLEERTTEHGTVWPGPRANLPHFTMSYFLFAESELAKTFEGPHGPDILVGDDTRIGRSVTGRDSCKLPTKWAQVSGNHCKIFYTSLKEPAGYWIEDTSTNGTLVNNERVAKLCSVPLAEGDRVQLSWNANGNPAATLEYVFRKQEAGADGLGKRCRSSSVPNDSPSGKRTRAGGDDDALLKSVAQLEHSNQDLRKRLDVERNQKEQYARQLTALKEEVTAAQHSAQEEAAVAQLQAQVNANKDAEVAKAAIQAAQEQTTSNEARAVEAEEKLAAEVAAHSDADAKFVDLEEKHTSLQEQETKLSAEVTALHEEVASLKTRAVNAEQHATELEQQLASEAETGKATLEALEKQSENLQAETEAAAAAKEAAEQAVKAAAESRSSEEEQKAARQAADAQLATTQAQLEDAQRAQQRAIEQQHNAEEVLSVKLALLQSMAQRFAQAGEAKRKAAELQVKAQERIAQADEDMRALGQQLMYAAAGKLQSNSGSKTAFQGETSVGAPTGGAGGHDGTERPDNETAVQQAHDAPDDTAAQPQSSPTLQLQLNRASTQRTVQADQPVIEDTQENEPEAPAAHTEEQDDGIPAHEAEDKSVAANTAEAAAAATRQEEAQSSQSAATSASTSPSMQSSSKGPDGDENVNNNSMDMEGTNSQEVVQKPDRASAASKIQSIRHQAEGNATVPNNSASLALRLPETAFYGQSMANNTFDEFAGME